MFRIISMKLNSQEESLLALFEGKWFQANSGGSRDAKYVSEAFVTKNVVASQPYGKFGIVEARVRFLTEWLPAYGTLPIIPLDIVDGN
jgi:hypothetical protein